MLISSSTVKENWGSMQLFDQNSRTTKHFVIFDCQPQFSSGVHLYVNS